jgi:hypothetical protein
MVSEEIGDLSNWTEDIVTERYCRGTERAQVIALFRGYKPRFDCHS